MKRLVFCFDGTWNKINENALTNVALTAAAVSNDGYLFGKNGKPDTSTKVPQIIHYDEGVGTNRLEKISGGALGKGLYENVKEAYTFLCLNYQPDDEIYIFGFSRGAYTARSFAGLIGNCGIMQSQHIEKVIKAASVYQQRSQAEDDVERQKLQQLMFGLHRNFGCEVTTCSAEDEWKRTRHGLEDHGQSRIKIAYLGLWDTVKTIIDTDRSEREFHDDDIPECALSGRHALALDEHRRTFDCTPWSNVDEANRRQLAESDIDTKFEDYRMSDDRAFQEVGFPGTHGGVGGGGEIRGLSDGALLWVLEGARKAGLSIDTTAHSKVYKLAPTPLAPLDNTEEDGLMENIGEFVRGLPVIGFSRRGPQDISEVSPTAVVRYACPPGHLPWEDDRDEDDNYRPNAITKNNSVHKGVKRLADQYKDEDFELYRGYHWEDYSYETRIVSGKTYEPYRVKSDDTLGKIAGTKLGSPGRYKELQACNRIMIQNADEIFSDQVINIPVSEE
jgi:uncharacterized protein (DUF2235 family)